MEEALKHITLDYTGQGYFFNEATTYGASRFVARERKLYGRINPRRSDFRD